MIESFLSAESSKNLTLIRSCPRATPFLFLPPKIVYFFVLKFKIIYVIIIMAIYISKRVRENNIGSRSREGDRIMRILISDDEIEIRKVLRLLLENAGYEILEASDGARAVETVRQHRDIDLCIMDIMMPAMSGIEATRLIREFSTVPVLFLSARSLESDKEAAYSGGGDDYIVKPFSSRELLMKVDALTRRYNSYSAKATDEQIIRLWGGVEISPDSREVTKNGNAIDIRDKEYDMLLYLAKNRGHVVSPGQLYENVWEEMPLPSSNNTITVHILNLRRKLEDNSAQPKLIRTVWGRGYQID